MNLHEKVKRIKELVRKELGIEEAQLMSMVRNIAKKHYCKSNKRRGVMLSQDELKLYDFLVRHCYNPSTVYKWLLLSEKCPEEIQYKLKEGLIGVREAFREKSKHRQYANMSNMEFINAIISCVELYYVEPVTAEKEVLE